MSGMIRVGRGGAGNFLSQKDVDEAERARQVNVSLSIGLLVSSLHLFRVGKMFTSMRLMPFLHKGGDDSLMRPVSQQDPESQKGLSPPPASTAVTQTPQYFRSGRGGAGNFAEPPTASDLQDRQDVVGRTKTAVSASQAGKPRTGLVGRGGAGNWTDDGDGATGADEDEQEKARQQQIADQIAQDIDATLLAPPKTYHQHDRDMERRGSRGE